MKIRSTLQPAAEPLADIEVQSIDHLGLVAAAIESLRLVELIDERLPLPHGSNIKVTHGQRVKAMIINGLGYTTSPLYLTPEFFSKKDVERLIGPGVEVEHFNDHALGRTLDAIFNYGTTKLFAEIAFEVAQSRQLFGSSVHIDTTTLLLHGDFTKALEQADKTKDMPKAEFGEMKSPPLPAYGRSKAHRHDLKQVVMSLTMTGNASMPLWYEGLSGNSSDKTNFHESIAKFEAFKTQVKVADAFLWVADSALYNKGKLQASTIKWLTRIPQTKSNAKMLVNLPDKEVPWFDIGNGYKAAVYNKLEENEHWTLFYSEQAYQRELITFNRRVGKALENKEKSLNKLCQTRFYCEKDALKAANKWVKNLKYHKAEFTTERLARYSKPGKPKKGAEPDIIEYRLHGELSEDKQKQALKCRSLGRFILGSNDTENTALTAQLMLKTYTEQQNVERGFRFIKSDEFHLDGVYLQLPSRIDALMMVMTLSLMVYNTSEYQLRETMAEQGVTLPNQKGKATTRPTLRWVFQMMQGIYIVKLAGMADSVAGKSETTEQIIRLFGATACAIYGVDS